MKFPNQVTTHPLVPTKMLVRAASLLILILTSTAPIASGIEIELATASDSETRTFARAIEAEIVTANDFLTNNDLNDDLYTFAFKIALNLGRFDVTLSENAFTDRTNETRFDETYLTVGRSLPPLGRWWVYGEAGVVHVGEGLLGQGVQNTVHGVLGDEEVHLPYIESREIHPTLALRAERDLRPLGPARTAAQVEVASAVGFKSHATASVKAAWQVLRPMRIEAMAGARYSDTSFETLEPWISDFGPVWEFGVELFERIAMTWNYNNYGTRMQHFQIGYRLKTLGKKK